MNSEKENSLQHLVAAKLINSVFTQPFEFLKLAQQTGYASTSSSTLQQRLTKFYKSAYEHQPQAIFTGLTMTILQQSMLALNIFKLYPFLMDHYASVQEHQNNLIKAEMCAAATCGFVHGLLATPFETIKLRQIGNTLMKNNSEDLKVEMKKPYVVKEFLFNPVMNVGKTGTKKTSDLVELKKVNNLIKLLPKEQVISYESFERLIGLRSSNDQAFLEQMKKNKQIAEEVYKTPATSILDTIKEMTKTNGSLFKTFSNAALITSIQTSIQTTTLVFSLHKMTEMREYAFKTESTSYLTQFLQSFILAKDNDKFVSQLAPLLIGIPSAFLTCALTQPLDNIKTVLQSGQFDKFRALADKQQITLHKNNIAEALVKCFIANNNLRGMYAGFFFRFIRLSFLQTGFGYGVTKELESVLKRYSELRRLQA